MQPHRVKPAPAKVPEEPEFESEMVVLERIDTQKKLLLRSYVARAHGRDLLGQSLALRNVSFGVKGRY